MLLQDHTIKYRSALKYLSGRYFIKQEKKPPRVPIKTYRWEDVKRARRRGGYPWTHLYKKPLSEDLDVDSYRIGGLRRGKSTSTMGDKSYLTISEMTESERDGSLSPEPMEKIDCTLQIVLEPDDESRAASAANSVVIEEYNGNGTEKEKETEKDDEKERETDTQRGGLFVMDSGESSDDISQYVDKEERTPPKKEKVEKMEVEDDSAKRKRKLSAESSYSRISQTKSAIIRKLKQTKDKIKVPKVPKISLPVSKIKRPVPKKSKSSPPTVKKETQKSTIPSPKTNQTPEYIHIPLKPPPGETDEFSHLEFEPKDAPKKEEKKAGSFKALIKNIKQLQELEAQQDAKKGLDFKEEESKDLKEDVVKEDVSKTVLGTEIPTETEITEARTTPVMRGVMTKLKDEESENKDDKVVDTLGEDKKEAIEVLKDEVAVAVDKVETKDEEEVEEGDSKKAAEQDIFDDLFRKSSFKKETPSTSRMGRSKSAEPERKRKLSLESSYSRKSLSRLGIMKRLKDASEKIKDTFSRSGSKKKTKTPDKPKEAIVKEPTKKSKELKPCKPVEPVYIHIPLKPPEGETDELSHLSKDKKVKNESKDTSASPQTPDSLQTPEDPSGNVQLIILTAPSDDEVLDYNSSDLPETPSSETKTFFDKTELAMLAKDAADAVKKLDPVKEENGSEKSLEEEEKGNGSIKRKGSKKGKEKEESTKSIEGEAGIKREGSKKAGEKESKEKEVSEDESSSITEESKKDKDKKAEVGEKVVDVEDGLSETKITQLPIPPEVPAAETTADPELKSSIKGGFGSPVMKKKVSFKRRSKSSKDGSYEDVQAPVEEKKQDAKDNENSEKLEALTPSQSMSVDEEKAYLEEKIIKHSSLEEDYNKWSKNIDHEYEPVCPPPDRASSPADHRQNLQHFPQTLSNPSVYVVDTDIIDPSILPLGEVPLDNHATVTKEPLRGQSASPDRQPTFVKFAPTEEVVAYHDEPPPQPAPGRFQQAFREKTENFKNKLHNIKRPHIKKPNIHLPDRPKFNKPNLQRFKIDKSKFHMPKIPDTTKINLPSFNLPRRQSTKSQATTPQPLKERNLSTEAHDGDAKGEKTGGFDFGTFPKMLKRIGRRRSRDQSDFGTAPRSKKSETSTQESSRWSGSESMRIPLHSEDSMDAVDRDGGPLEVGDMTSGGPLESSHARYEHEIGNEDEEEEFENGGGEFNGRVERDFHDRWRHGRFNEEEEDREFEGRYGRSQKVTDLDSPEDAPRYDFNANNRDNYSSAGSSAGIHRSGVLEEINSDEFIWRQKGISQEDVDMRRYLTSEIKEAFKTPQNALTQLDDPHGRHYDLRGSNQSLPEVGGKRKPIRKPKRKKTPHASQEKIHQYVEDSASEDVEASPPSRPRRRSKRTRKPKSEEIVPFQETHAVEVEDSRFGHRESLGGILGDDEGEDDGMTYENERMIGKEHPEIKVQDPYKNLEFEREVVQLPAAPPRKHKSLKSLTMSENGSLLGVEAEIEVIKTDSKLIIPIEPDSPPSRPSRSRSRANSQSRGTSRDDESLSRRSYSAAVDSEPPCVEEPCMKEVCDYMGYSVVDKSKVRDPPLPPPRAPRKKRSTLMHEEKFFTVPRAKGSTETPVRPLRNYSTLIQAKKATDPSATENKENFHIMQYAEIDDEPHKDALSKPAGDVIKKIQDRPLPAPPRPPRRSRQESGGPLRDITSQENIASRSVEDLDKQYLDEAHTATQTEPLSDDFVCAEVVQEPSDTVLTPSITKEKPTIERRLITPTVYSYEETITHGSLVVEPLDGAKILPEHQLSRERLIPVTKDSDYDETSSIPEEFTRLKDPPKPSEFDVVRTQKLQVGDLDVDTLTVNRLLADKIVVSEIDSSSIQTNEISSNTGALKIGEISLPPGVIESIMKTMQSSQIPKEESSEDAGQKKTSISQRIDGEEILYSNQDAPFPSNNEEPPTPPPRNLELENTVKEIQAHQTSLPSTVDEEHLRASSIEPQEEEAAPPRPPRHVERPRIGTSSSQEQDDASKTPLEQPAGLTTEQILSSRLLEPDVDDEPPPRPPQPSVEYIPSQPPASFYALRAQKLVESHDGNIPVVPRRRRHTRSRHRTRSNSESSSPTDPPQSQRRLHRRSSEPSLTQLTGQLARACALTANQEIKRLVNYILRNVLANDDGKQDLNVMIIIMLVLIAGLILLGYGEEKTVVHLHHWEYFNPPTDL